VVAPREAEAEEKGAMDLEKGVLKRRAFPISESHVLIVRALTEVADTDDLVEFLKASELVE